MPNISYSNLAQNRISYELLYMIFIKSHVTKIHNENYKAIELLSERRQDKIAAHSGNIVFGRIAFAINRTLTTT